MAHLNVPANLSNRFAHQQQPCFKVIRKVGDVRLWRSTTRTYEDGSLEAVPELRYHVEVGQEVSAFSIPDLESAQARFAAAAMQHGVEVH